MNRNTIIVDKSSIFKNWFSLTKTSKIELQESLHYNNNGSIIKFPSSVNDSYPLVGKCLIQWLDSRIIAAKIPWGISRMKKFEFQNLNQVSRDWYGIHSVGTKLTCFHPLKIGEIELSVKSDVSWKTRSVWEKFWNELSRIIIWHFMGMSYWVCRKLPIKYTDL